MPLHLTPSFSGNPRMINGFSQRDIQAENCCLLLFLRVFPEHTAELLSARVANKSRSAVSASNARKKGGRSVRVCMCVRARVCVGHRMLKDAERA